MDDSSTPSSNNRHSNIIQWNCHHEVSSCENGLSSLVTGHRVQRSFTGMMPGVHEPIPSVSGMVPSQLDPNSDTDLQPVEQLENTEGSSQGERPSLEPAATGAMSGVHEPMPSVSGMVPSQLDPNSNSDLQPVEQVENTMASRQGERPSLEPAAAALSNVEASSGQHIVRALAQETNGYDPEGASQPTFVAGGQLLRAPSTRQPPAKNNPATITADSEESKAFMKQFFITLLVKLSCGDCALLGKELIGNENYKALLSSVEYQDGHISKETLMSDMFDKWVRRRGSSADLMEVKNKLEAIGNKEMSDNLDKFLQG